MRRFRIPPLSALRGFEAATRHLSFARAAAELHVTQSAISHQVRQIEALWEVALFERRAGRVVPTPEGHALASVVRDFLQRLEGTLREVRDAERESVLRVNVHNSFGVTWLLPHLRSFRVERPEIRVFLSTAEFAGFDASDADVAIRLGAGDWTGAHQEMLLKEYVFPVCSPALLAARGRPRRPADLLAFPLLVRHRPELDGRPVPPPSWAYWFARNGVEDAEFRPSAVFPHTSMALQAAIDGQGVAIVRSAHITDQLERGMLVRPVDAAVPSSVAYYVLCRDGRQNAAPVRLFTAWLRREAAAAQRRYDREARA